MHMCKVHRVYALCTAGQWVSEACYALPSRHRTGNALQNFVKTDNQSLKHKVNECVPSLRLNECKLSASRTAAGRLYSNMCTLLECTQTQRQRDTCWSSACLLLTSGNSVPLLCVNMFSNPPLPSAADVESSHCTDNKQQWHIIFNCNVLVTGKQSVKNKINAIMTCITSVRCTQLNSSLFKNCSQKAKRDTRKYTEKTFKITVERRRTKIQQMIMASRTTPRLRQSIQTSIYSADSAILRNLLLIFSQGIVGKRAIFISLSYWVQCAVEAGKEFLNHDIGEEGHVHICRMVWPSKRTSSAIHISEQSGAVLWQMHMQNHTAYHIQFGKWFSGPSSAKTPVFVTVQQSGHGATRHIHIVGQVLSYYRTVRLSGSLGEWVSE